LILRPADWGKLDDVYALLYESLLSWFAGRRATSVHGHLYAVAALAAVAFVNVSSVVVLCAYIGFAWARQLFFVGRPWLSSLLLALGLLAVHLFLFRGRRRDVLPPPLPKSRQQQTRWIGAAYVLLSLVVFLYISALAPTLL
jgi:hypothetical protein